MSDFETFHSRAIARAATNDIAHSLRVQKEALHAVYEAGRMAGVRETLDAAKPHVSRETLTKIAGEATR